MRAFTAATLKRWRDRPRSLRIGLAAGTAAIIVVILIVVFSGGDDDGSGPGEIGSEAVAGPSTSDTTDDPDDGETKPTVVETMADLERVWAEARAEVVAELSSDEYGVGDDNVLRGPAGFEVDLNDCPTPWSDTEGVDGDTIKVGHPTPLSGTLAIYSQLSTGMEAYFDYVNANGGIAGRQIELITRDNGYQDTKTIVSSRRRWAAESGNTAGRRLSRPRFRRRAACPGRRCRRPGSRRRREAWGGRPSPPTCRSSPRVGS